LPGSIHISPFFFFPVPIPHIFDHVRDLCHSGGLGINDESEGQGQRPPGESTWKAEESAQHPSKEIRVESRKEGQCNQL
jgi:hypothetical protein